MQQGIRLAALEPGRGLPVKGKPGAKFLRQASFPGFLPREYPDPEPAEPAGRPEPRPVKRSRRRGDFLLVRWPFPERGNHPHGPVLAAGAGPGENPAGGNGGTGSHRQRREQGGRTEPAARPGRVSPVPRGLAGPGGSAGCRTFRAPERRASPRAAPAFRRIHPDNRLAVQSTRN